MKARPVLGVFVALLGISWTGFGEELVPLTRAHSHNDYMRARPLFDALDQGFCSVEADIWLVDGELLVAHDRDQVKPGETLQKIYLDPILERVRKNGGRVYPGGPECTLLIDFKDNGPRTYAKLREVLEQYKEMLTVYTKDSTEPKALRIIISGNCPRPQIAADSPRFVAVDGRPPDLDRDIPCHLIPLISASWTSVFKWTGEGDMPGPELQKLRDMIAKAHAKGQQIRFWALPVRPAVLPLLYAEGVDLLNADDPPAMRAFLLERMQNAKN